MGNKKTIGIVLIAIGLVVLVVSLAADALGIGADSAAFGYRQIIGSIVGVIVAAFGYYYSRQ
jgi:hypothetical protein